MTSKKTILNENLKAKIQHSFNHETLPNTFIIGAPKCGTTSIFRYLEMSQEVFAPHIKEPSFFSNLDKAQDQLDWYARLYDEANHRIRLDSTSINIYSSIELPHLINSLDSNAKIILILRDPVQRFLSFFGFLKHMNLISGEICVDDFIDITLANLKENSSLKNHDYHIEGSRYLDSTLEGGLYAEHIKLWHDVFEDRMRLYFFDDLADSPTNVMSNIADFLNIEDIWKGASLRTENQTLSPRSRLIHNALISIYSKIGTSLNKRKATKRFLLDMYILLNNKKKKTNISSDAQLSLRNFYEKDLNKTVLLLEEKKIHHGNFPNWLR